jgi:hypothetical protein
MNGQTTNCYIHVYLHTSEIIAEKHWFFWEKKKRKNTKTTHLTFVRPDSEFQYLSGDDKYKVSFYTEEEEAKWTDAVGFNRTVFNVSEALWYTEENPFSVHINTQNANDYSVLEVPIEEKEQTIEKITTFLHENGQWKLCRTRERDYHQYRYGGF